MSKRMRVVLAIITGLITSLMAFQLSFALMAEATERADQDACTTATRIAYEDALTDPNVEQEPAYQLAAAEAFLEFCDTPLHVQAVAKQAARAALDAGETAKSLNHFELALNNGAALTEKEQLDYMLSLWLNGKTERAWTLRDELIDYWLARADRVATVTSTNVRDGLIYKIVFDNPSDTIKTRIHWLAQPHGEGWPAAISLNSDPSLVALATFRMGPAAQSMQDLTFTQCRGRKTAARKFGEIDPDIAEETALNVLTAYLGAPQVPAHKAAGQPAATCYSTDRLLTPLR